MRDGEDITAGRQCRERGEAKGSRDVRVLRRAVRWYGVEIEPRSLDSEAGFCIDDLKTQLARGLTERQGREAAENGDGEAEQGAGITFHGRRNRSEHRRGLSRCVAFATMTFFDSHNLCSQQKLTSLRAEGGAVSMARERLCISDHKPEQCGDYEFFIASDMAGQPPPPRSRLVILAAPQDEGASRSLFPDGDRTRLAKAPPGSSAKVFHALPFAELVVHL